MIHTLSTSIHYSNICCCPLGAQCHGVLGPTGECVRPQLPSRAHCRASTGHSLTLPDVASGQSGVSTSGPRAAKGSEPPGGCPSGPHPAGPFCPAPLAPPWGTRRGRNNRPACSLRRTQARFHKPTAPGLCRLAPEGAGPVPSWGRYCSGHPHSGRWAEASCNRPPGCLRPGGQATPLCAPVQGDPGP